MVSVLNRARLVMPKPCPRELHDEVEQVALNRSSEVDCRTGGS